MSVALITGGQQGIGLAIARALRDAGFRIAIAAEQPEDAAPVQDGLAALGPQARYFRHDLSKIEDVPALLDAGLCAMVNSDDPAYFGGYVNANFEAVFAATGMDASAAYQLAANSFEASSADASAKRRWSEQLQACFERAHDTRA